MLKSSLSRINHILSSYNARPSLWKSVSNWNHEYSLIKNILRTSNRALVYFNRYHIFRWDWMVGLLGCLTGLLVVFIQDNYSKITHGYKSYSSFLVKNYILQNETIKQKLKEALVSNVFYNPDVQFQVHELLMHQAILPQISQIKKLINYGVSLINQPQLHTYLVKEISKQVPLLHEPIKTNALDFLGSETMDEIVANGFKAVLSSLWFKLLVAQGFKDTLTTQLNNDQNQEYAYKLVKEKLQ